MRLKKILPCLILLTILLVINALIDAGHQKTGSIEGTITDTRTGDPISGVSIMIEGTSIGSVSDIDGTYTIEQIKPGIYTLRFSHIDYGIVQITNVKVTVNKTIVRSVQLSLKKKEVGKTISMLDELADIVHTPNVSKQAVEERDAEVKSQSNQPLTQSITIQPKKKHRDKRGKIIVQPADYYNRYTYPPPAHGGNAIVNGQAYDAMFFENYGVNPFVDTEDDHLSTFAIDVDDASYIMARSYLNDGNIPPKDAVRTEEFVNHFNYNYAPPRRQPFQIYFEGAPSKFGKNSQLIKIGIKGKEIAKENRKDANLVFVVDISGSMSSGNRLGLVKKSLTMLVEELNPNDKVGIVVYGSHGEVRLEPTSIKKRQRILNAIESLYTGGATNAEQGLKLGYKMAQRYFEPNKINRIILCSDGVANVGTTGPDAILKKIKKYADQGITLSTVGFGMSNYNDILMEKLGNKGNGSYAYVDDIHEAHRIFVENLTGNLQVIARDVKIQVDFNPEVVRSYRLLGYENRDVADNKFRDDKEDGGEIGAGHEVTALYEVKFRKNAKSDYVGTVYVRYKDDTGYEVSELNRGIQKSMFHKKFKNASYEFRLATVAAEYAEVLRKSYWAKDSDPQKLLNVAANLLSEHRTDELIELIGMIAKTNRYEEGLAKR